MAQALHCDFNKCLDKMGEMKNLHTQKWIVINDKKKLNIKMRIIR